MSLRQEVTALIEAYAKRPSDAGKQVSSILALFEQREREVCEEIKKKAEGFQDGGYWLAVPIEEIDAILASRWPGKEKV